LAGATGACNSLVCKHIARLMMIVVVFKCV
jgi:hypothetical protein